MGFFRKLFRHDDAAPAVEPTPAVAQPADTPAASSTAAAPAPNADKSTAPLELPDEQALDDHAFELDGTDFLGTQQLQNAPLPVAALASDRPLSMWAARDVGRVRRSNQDNVFATLMSLPDIEHDIPVGLFVVADGMGGHHGGEIASRRAVETVMITMLEQLALPAMADEEPGNSLPVLMVSAVQEANHRIWEEAQAQGSDMGTTCTAALLVGRHLYVAHVGDSRAYFYTPAGLQQITTDHSTVGRLIAMDQLKPEEARDHPLRNQLYRTVGQHPTVEVDSLYHAIEGVSHLLLCSDGLWGMVDDAEIAQIIAESPFPQDICQRLIARANLAGGEDNISVVVVTFPSELRSV